MPLSSNGLGDVPYGPNPPRPYKKGRTKKGEKFVSTLKPLGKRFTFKSRKKK